MIKWQQAKSVAFSGVFHASFDFIVCSRIREKNISHLIITFVTSFFTVLTLTQETLTQTVERPRVVCRIREGYTEIKW